MSDEDGELFWMVPNFVYTQFDASEPLPWRVCKSLISSGAFTRDGLEIVSSVWGNVDFNADQNWSEARSLTEDMLLELGAAGLITADATNEDVNNLYRFWQIPMYNIDFKKIKVPLEELISEREAFRRSFERDCYGI